MIKQFSKKYNEQLAEQNLAPLANPNLPDAVSRNFAESGTDLFA